MNSSQTKKVYNQDVIENGGYLYTGKSIYSATVATRKQTQEIHTLIRKFFPQKIRILDVGCGDGTYTVQMLNEIAPENIVGFDLAENAIRIARKKVSGKKNISFDTGDIYKISRKIQSGKF